MQVRNPLHSPTELCIESASPEGFDYHHLSSVVEIHDLIGSPASLLRTATMKSYISVLSWLITAAASVSALEGHPACPPISGDLTVNLRNIYPEGVDFFPPNCKIYVG